MELSDVKRNLNKQVIYRDKPYILTGCILRKIQDDFYYQAEIKCINANSVVTCRLEDLERYDKNSNGNNTISQHHV